jgi:hypothetical protein
MLLTLFHAYRCGRQPFGEKCTHTLKTLFNTSILKQAYWKRGPIVSKYQALEWIQQMERCEVVWGYIDSLMNMVSMVNIDLKKCVTYPQEDFLFTILKGAPKGHQKSIFKTSKVEKNKNTYALKITYRWFSVKSTILYIDLDHKSVEFYDFGCYFTILYCFTVDFTVSLLILPFYCW